MWLPRVDKKDRCVIIYLVRPYALMSWNSTLYVCEDIMFAVWLEHADWGKFLIAIGIEVIM